MKVIKHFDEAGELLHFNTDEFSQLMDNARNRENALNEMINSINDSFYNLSNDRIRLNYPMNEINTNIYITIRKIERCEGNYPDRLGSSSLPTLTGYAPDSVYESVLNNKIRNKLNKRQLALGDGFKILFVDINRIQISRETYESFYTSKFTQSAIEFSRQGINYDAVAIGNCRSDRKETFDILHIITKETLDKSKIVNISLLDMTQVDNLVWLNEKRKYE